VSNWNNKVKRLLKSELVKRGVSTEDLTKLLNENGCSETKSSVDSKISRGTFSASFFIQCLYVIGCTKIEIEDYHNLYIDSENPNVEYKIIENEN
jgi:putative GMP synthase, PP-ATPase domain/subunit